MSEAQNVAREQGYNMTAEQRIEDSKVYKEIKQGIKLMDFATEKLGWQVSPVQEDDRGVVLKHQEHGTITAPRERNPKTGNWGFFWTHGQGGGNLIDLLEQQGWKWDKIRTLKDSLPTAHQVTSEAPQASVSQPSDENKKEQSSQKETSDQHKERDPKKQTALAQAKFDEVKLEPGASYLEKQGIDGKMYASFPQVKTNGKEAAFMLYNVVEGKAHLCSTVRYCTDKEGKSVHFFQKDLPRGLAVLKGEGSVERLVVSESPINALSFKQVEEMEGHKVPGTMYVSTCGKLTERTSVGINHLFKEAKAQGQSVVLARSGDEEGIKISRELSVLAEQHGVGARISIPPARNDWNAYLNTEQAKEKIPEEVRQQLEDFIQSKKIAKVSFPSPAYENTLFEHLPIPEKACKGVKSYEAGEREISFPIYADAQSVMEKKSIGTYRFQLEGDGLSSYTETRGTSAGLVVVPAHRSPDSVVITSSPMDIFLHKAAEQANTGRLQKLLNPPATLYVSTCGQKGRDLQKPLQSILDHYHEAKVVFYMNNKEARDLRLSLDKKLLNNENKGFSYQVSPPIRAAWHEEPPKESQVVQQEMLEQKKITPRQSQSQGMKVA
ncbi:MAG: toprim domain-containing protein [Bacteroidota bacterium]